jgi:hypothetical protein
MLAAVHISIWTAVKHDRKVSRQVADEHGAPETAGRYNKKLLNGAARLDDLRSLAGQMQLLTSCGIPYRIWCADLLLFSRTMDQSLG